MKRYLLAKKRRYKTFLYNYRDAFKIRVFGQYPAAIEKPPVEKRKRRKQVFFGQPSLIPQPSRIRVLQSTPIKEEGYYTGYKRFRSADFVQNCHLKHDIYTKSRTFAPEYFKQLFLIPLSHVRRRQKRRKRKITLREKRKFCTYTRKFAQEYINTLLETFDQISTSQTQLAVLAKLAQRRSLLTKHRFRRPSGMVQLLKWATSK